MSISTAKKLFKWPISLFVLLILLIEITVYVVVRLMIRTIEWLNGLCRRDNSLRSKLNNSTTCDEYTKTAIQLDLFDYRKQWIEKEKTDLYNYKELKQLFNNLTLQQKLKNYNEIMNLLQLYFLKSKKEYEISELFSCTYLHTKKLVSDFLDKLKELLHEIKESPDILLEDKIKFFKKAVDNNGETALCFSGGAKLTFFHIGVLYGLFEHNLLPNVISGTSGGAMIAAAAAVRNDEEIAAVKNTLLNLCEKVWKISPFNYLKKGYLMNSDLIKERIYQICFGDTTFKEAFEKTGRVLNITVTKREEIYNPVMLNYRSTPDVCIWSAVIASSALPNFLPAGELFAKGSDGKIYPYHSLGKYWFDGSYKSDVPAKFLREKFNVTYTIVSQANPHVILFALENEGSIGNPPVHRSGYGFKGGFVLSGIEIFLRVDMRKWIIFLRELGISPSIFGYDFGKVIVQKYHGTVTIYAKATFFDYMWLLKTASAKDIHRLIMIGTREFWRKKNMISMRIGLDKILKNSLYSCIGNF